MTTKTRWGAPIRCKVEVIAQNDLSRRENGQETLIPFGTAVRVSEPRGWWDRMSGNSSLTRIIEWPYGVNSNNTHITFLSGDPTAVKLQGALSSRTA